MTARSLLALFDSVYVIALTAWVGSVLFFSFGVAPITFTAAGPDSGGTFVKALLPRYYAWGAIWGAIALPAFLGVPLSFPEYRGPLVAVQAMAILAGVLIMLYGGNTLAPALNADQAAIPSEQGHVDRLRRRSVWLNHAVLALGVGLLVGFANRPAPRSSGIVEMTPIERARYNQEIGRVIEEMEVRQGLRAPRTSPGPAMPAGASERPPIDGETIKELNEIFDRKRARDARTSKPSQGPAWESQKKPPERRP